MNRICYYIPADALVWGRGFRVSVVVEGQPGHHPTGVWPNDGTQEMPYFYGRQKVGFSYEAALKAVMGLNQQMGISPKEANEIVASSIGAQIRGDRAPESTRADTQGEDAKGQAGGGPR